MQVEQNLIDQLNSKNHSKQAAGNKGIANYIQGSSQGVGGSFDVYADAPAYRKSSAELGIFADDTVIGGAGVYRKPGMEEGQSLAEQATNPTELTPEQRHNQMAVLANTASAEDFQKMQEEGFDPANADSSTIVTVTDKIKAALAQAGDYIEGFTDDLSKEQLVQITGSTAVAEQIVKALKSHDLPVTLDNVTDSVKAWNQVQSMGGISDSAIAYVLKNNLTPSIANLYTAQHCGVGAGGSWGAAAGIDLSGMEEQIRQIIEESGLEATPENMEAGKWLISNQIPLTGKNMKYLQQLKSLSGEIAEMGKPDYPMTDKIANAMAAAITEGSRPADGMLLEGYSIQDRAKEAYDIIHSATEEDLAYCIANNEPLTVENLQTAITARTSQETPEPEVAHVLDMAARDASLGIGTNGQAAGNALSAEEQEAIAAKMTGGSTTGNAGLSIEEMDEIVARMTESATDNAEPEMVPDTTDSQPAVHSAQQPIRGGQIDLTTDGIPAEKGYADPNIGTMINMTTEDREAMGDVALDNYGISYDYTSELQGSVRATRTTGTADYMGSVPNNYMDYATMYARATPGQRREMSQRISMITSQRQLEEARLVMTMEANQSLMKRGIAIDTRPLEQLVEDLRAQEDFYYQSLLQGNGIHATDERISILADTTRMITEMQYQPAYILDFGSSTSTIPRLHEAGQSMQYTFERANQTYEAMMTMPDEELGDSISQAFQNIDEILEDLHMELSDGNRRAVRILSYNQTALTPENIQKMKAVDEEVQRTFKNLTPSVTMEMIRQNKNPLDMTIEQVNQLAEQIKNEQGEQDVERFSKYLYKLEQNNKISEEERSGYIGIYRLISQVEKTDGAAIGYLVNQGAEVTMRNLLTAVRTSQRGTIDYSIGDKVEGGAPKKVSPRIDNQIEAAFQHNCIRDVAEEITPQKVMEISQEELMDMTPEQLKEAVVKAEDDLSADQAYAQEEFAQYSEAMNASEDVYAFLDRYDVPNTMLNIVAASRMLKSPSQMFKDLWRGGAIHAVAEMKKEALTRFGEAIKNPEELADAQETLAETAEDAMKDMIVEENSVRSLDVREMRILSRQFQICAKRAKEECYMIPMRIGSMITGVSLKVVRGKKEKGLVDVLFDNTKTGKVAASFEARENDIVGFVAIDREVAGNYFNEHIDELTSAIAGEETENVKLQIVYAPDVSLESYEMKSLKWEQRQKANGENAAGDEKSPVQTRRLYKIAENFLGAVQRLSKSM